MVGHAERPEYRCKGGALSDLSIEARKVRSCRRLPKCAGICHSFMHACMHAFMHSCIHAFILNAPAAIRVRLACDSTSRWAKLARAAGRGPRRLSPEPLTLNSEP